MLSATASRYLDAPADVALADLYAAYVTIHGRPSRGTAAAVKANLAAARAAAEAKADARALASLAAHDWPVSSVDALLDAAQGRARARTLDTLPDPEPGAAVRADGGKPPRSYGYPAESTVAVAVRLPDGRLLARVTRERCGTVSYGSWGEETPIAPRKLPADGWHVIKG